MLNFISNEYCIEIQFLTHGIGKHLKVCQYTLLVKQWGKNSY